MKSVYQRAICPPMSVATLLIMSKMWEWLYHSIIYKQIEKMYINMKKYVMSKDLKNPIIFNNVSKSGRQYTQWNSTEKGKNFVTSILGI